MGAKPGGPERGVERPLFILYIKAAVKTAQSESCTNIGLYAEPRIPETTDLSIPKLNLPLEYKLPS